MVALADLEKTKVSMRVDHNDADNYIQDLIEVSSEIVIEFIKDNAATFYNPNASPQVFAPPPLRVVQAVMRLTAHMYHNVDVVGDFTLGRLPLDVSRLLWSFRVPTMSGTVTADGSPSSSP